MSGHFAAASATAPAASAAHTAARSNKSGISTAMSARVAENSSDHPRGISSPAKIPTSDDACQPVHITSDPPR